MVLRTKIIEENAKQNPKWNVLQNFTDKKHKQVCQIRVHHKLAVCFAHAEDYKQNCLRAGQDCTEILDICTEDKKAENWQSKKHRKEKSHKIL